MTAISFPRRSGVDSGPATEYTRRRRYIIVVYMAEERTCPRPSDVYHPLHEPRRCSHPVGPFNRPTRGIVNLQKLLPRRCSFSVTDERVASSRRSDVSPAMGPRKLSRLGSSRAAGREFPRRRADFRTGRAARRARWRPGLGRCADERRIALARKKSASKHNAGPRSVAIEHVGPRGRE